MNKEKWYVILILAAAILAAAGSWLFAVLTYVPVYQTEAALVIGRMEEDGDLSSGLSASGALADAFAELLNSSLMHRAILDELGSDRFDGSILAERIPETNLLDLKVTASDPDTALRVICFVLEQHDVISRPVMGDLDVTVLREPQLPKIPVNSLNMTEKTGPAALYAAMFAAVLCIWHAWSRCAVGMENSEESRPELDLPGLLVDILRQGKRIWAAGLGLILVCALGLCAYQYAGYQPQYEMLASFTVRLENGEEDGFPSRTANQLAKTMPRILAGEVLLQQIRENLALEEKPEVSLSVSAGSRIMTLTVRNSDPDITWEVLSAVLSCYPEVADHVVGPTTLVLLEESGIPEEPVQPFSAWTQIRNGACLGFGLWMTVSVLMALYHLTVHSEKELSPLLQCDCLGENGNTRDGLCADTSLSMGIILITSSLPGEGKSTVAWNLAQSLAQQGKRVLLAECNPGNPSLTKQLGFRRKLGISEYLNGQAGLRDIIRKTGVRNLYAAPWGTASGNRGIQNKTRGEKLLREAGKLFDCVILDGPPVSGMEDIADIAQLAEGSILVVRKNWTTRERIKETEQQLLEMGIPAAGSILNSIR